MNEQQRAGYTPEFVQKLRFVDRWQAVIPGMAAKAQEVKQEFFKRVQERAFASVSISPGQIEIEKQCRDYDFLTLTLDPELDARAVVAVRIAPFANDLAAQWWHYELPPYKWTRRGYRVQQWVMVALAAIFGGGTVVAGVVDELPGLTYEGLALIALFVLIGIFMKRPRRDVLQGFQPQDSWAFRESVDQALREALDVVGISAEMIRELPKEKRRSEQAVKTANSILCPACGHENPAGTTNCQNCHINLAWALEHMGTGEKQRAADQEVSAGPLEQLPMRVMDLKDLGEIAWRVLIPGMAAKANEVVEGFVQQFRQRQIPDAAMFGAEVKVEGKRRRYWLAMRTLGKHGAAAWRAVYVTASGQDLYVEIRDNTRGDRQDPILAVFGVLIGIPLILAWGFGLLLIIKALTPRDLTESQNQEAWAFNQAVDRALREALDMVGISAEMFQEMPKEKRAI